MRIASAYRSHNGLMKRAESARLNAETRQFAEYLPDFYKELFQAEGKFNYRVQSIPAIEMYLKKLAGTETEKCDLDIIMLAVGAHLGEIIRHEIGGRWVKARQPSISPSDIDFESEFRLPNGSRLDLTARAWNAFTGKGRKGLRRYISAVIKQGRKTAPRLKREADGPEPGMRAGGTVYSEAEQKGIIASGSPM